MQFSYSPAGRRLFSSISAILVVIASAARAKDSPGPLEVVQAYTEAANRHDLEEFLSLYAPDITKYQFPQKVLGSGIDNYREKYKKSFATKTDIQVEIVSMITLGDKVVVRDRVTGLPGGKSADELTIYEVQDGKITKIVYVERREDNAVGR